MAKSKGSDFERRSEAARLGWETRRENAARAEEKARADFERRSEASRMGWETRRAREAEEEFTDWETVGEETDYYEPGGDYGDEPWEDFEDIADYDDRDEVIEDPIYKTRGGK